MRSSCTVDANHSGCCTGCLDVFLVGCKFVCSTANYSLDFHIFLPHWDLSLEKLLPLNKQDEIKLKLKSLNKTNQFYFMYCLSKTLKPNVPPGHFFTIADIKSELDSFSQMIKWPEKSMSHGLQWTMCLYLTAFRFDIIAFISFFYWKDTFWYALKYWNYNIVMHFMWICSFFIVSLLNGCFKLLILFNYWVHSG